MDKRFMKIQKLLVLANDANDQKSMSALAKTRLYSRLSCRIAKTILGASKKRVRNGSLQVPEHVQQEFDQLLLVLEKGTFHKTKDMVAFQEGVREGKQFRKKESLEYK
ncbi:hypothetical protein [Enterococcus sp. C76]|uniref:hypothetical protein n=1 Tax=Enterococcus sp. C76 TaxID=3231334 RepID=UPI0034A0A9F0